MVFGNPDFSGKGLIASNTSSTPLLAMRSLDQRDLQSLFLIPLPGTSNECVALAAQANDGLAGPSVSRPRSDEANSRPSDLRTSCI